ncbi:MAG: hypothetical protein ACXW3Q_10970, partial [Rhodoplanes sp.]
EDSPRKAENVASGPLTHPLRPHSVKSVEQPWPEAPTREAFGTKNIRPCQFCRGTVFTVLNSLRMFLI